MRLLASALLAIVCLAPSGFGREGYLIQGSESAAWQKILAPLGQWPNAQNPKVIVGLTATKEIREAATDGAIVVLEGDSVAGRALGFVPQEERIAGGIGGRVTVRGIHDQFAPELLMAWEKPLDLPRFSVPSHAKVFTKERWSKTPLAASIQLGKGAVLWLAAPVGDSGYERFPYLPQALSELGLEAPYQARNLWAFFDWSYRRRVDLDFMAARWRASGIAGLHVAAWHFYDRDPDSEQYLKRLIEACHKNRIQVYAWLELPHVSERFWHDHPEWREKTAAGQDAHLDWRKLMSLQHPDCRKAIENGLRGLLQSFDWDGVNLAELYFESLEGSANLARFTPYHPVVLDRFQRETGRLPTSSMGEFVEFRARLAEEMQRDWLAFLKDIRQQRPHLDLVLTHVDDRFDRRMREMIGADAARLMPLLEKEEFTFLVEDPATVWHLGPERYPKIAAEYAAITKRTDRLAIDINVVERYQDVYPTKQQTGTELFRLVHLAAGAFSRVALYFENSLLGQDLGWLPTSAAAVGSFQRKGRSVEIASDSQIRLRWTGGAKVDGQEWAAVDADSVAIPAGKHLVEASTLRPLRILDFNGDLLAAKYVGDTIKLHYKSTSRARVHLTANAAISGVGSCGSEPCTIVLPAGEHEFLVRENPAISTSPAPTEDPGNSKPGQAGNRH